VAQIDERTLLRPSHLAHEFLQRRDSLNFAATFRHPLCYQGDHQILLYRLYCSLARPSTRSRIGGRAAHGMRALFIRLLSMKHALFLLLGTLGITLGANLLVRIATSTPGPVYTVAALQRHLAQEPSAWVGRAVRVRATVYADGCATWDDGTLPACREWLALLFDPEEHASVPPLTLARGPMPPLLAALRRVPVLQRLAPAPQVVHWETVATYRIQLRAASCHRGGAPRCTYEALLLDAAPFAS
jgi:hypothetical protein